MKDLPGGTIKEMMEADLYSLCFYQKIQIFQNCKISERLEKDLYCKSSVCEITYTQTVENPCFALGKAGILK